MNIDGFKRIYAMPLKDIITLPILLYPGQRPIDLERVDEIIAYQHVMLEKYKSLFISGAIVLVPVNGTEYYYLVDAQHRYHAIKKDLATIMPDYVVEVAVIEGVSPADVFRDINELTPVPRYIKETIDKPIERNYIDEFQKVFKKTYGRYVSKSDVPRPPNINIDDLIKNLREYGLFTRFENASKLMAFIDYVNYEIAKEYPHFKAVVLAREKAEKWGVKALYLETVTYDEWMDNEMLILTFEQKWNEDQALQDTYNAMFEKKKVKRVNFKECERNKLWVTYFGDKRNLGKCAYCRCPLHFVDFHMGHVISVQNGGTNDLDNIRPLCSSCNISMGDKNMDEKEIGWLHPEKI